MLDGRYQRGFSPERLASTSEPKVRKDDKEYFIMSVSENSKVYFDDYYGFLEATYTKTKAQLQCLNKKLDNMGGQKTETIAYNTAQV